MTGKSRSGNQSTQEHVCVCICALSCSDLHLKPETVIKHIHNQIRDCHDTYCLYISEEIILKCCTEKVTIPFEN